MAWLGYCSKTFLMRAMDYGEVAGMGWGLAVMVLDLIGPMLSEVRGVVCIECFTYIYSIYYIYPLLTLCIQEPYTNYSLQ